MGLWKNLHLITEVDEVEEGNISETLRKVERGKNESFEYFFFLFFPFQLLQLGSR